MGLLRVLSGRPLVHVGGACVVVVAAVFAGAAVPAREPASPSCSLCTIVVPAGETHVLQQDTIATCVTIGFRATLATNGHTLTLIGPGDSSIADRGRLILSDGSALTISLLSHRISGQGAIDGTHNNARIDIGPGLTLTSETNITGQLRIRGLSIAFVRGAFLNHGTVGANREDGILVIERHTILDGGTGDWKVAGFDTAKLQFDAGSTLLSGDFTVSHGEMEFNAAVTTTGRFDIASVIDVNENVQTTRSEGGLIFRSGASIDVASGKSFTFQSFDSPKSDCPNPDNTEGDIDPPFEVAGGPNGFVAQCR